MQLLDSPQQGEKIIDILCCPIPRGPSDPLAYFSAATPSPSTHTVTSAPSSSSSPSGSSGVSDPFSYLALTCAMTNNPLATTNPQPAATRRLFLYI